MNRLRAVFGMTAVLFLAGQVVACPNCKDALAGPEGSGLGGSGTGLALGFELSIYLMLLAPVAIVAGLAGLFYLQILSAQRNPELWDQADPNLVNGE